MKEFRNPLQTLRTLYYIYNPEYCQAPEYAVYLCLQLRNPIEMQKICTDPSKVEEVEELLDLKPAPGQSLADRCLTIQSRIKEYCLGVSTKMSEKLDILWTPNENKSEDACNSLLRKYRILTPEDEDAEEDTQALLTEYRDITYYDLLYTPMTGFLRQLTQSFKSKPEYYKVLQQLIIKWRSAVEASDALTPDETAWLNNLYRLGSANFLALPLAQQKLILQTNWQAQVEFTDAELDFILSLHQRIVDGKDNVLSTIIC